MGEKLVSDILYELQNNERIIALFGNLIPVIRSGKDKLLKQRAKMFETTTGVVLEALTKGQRVRGKRAGLLFVDDPEEDSDVATKKKIKKFREWFFATLYNVLYPTAKVVVLGTVISKDCLVKYLVDEKKRKSVYYKAIHEGRPLRQSMRPVKALKKRREEVGRAVFNQEFMHIPIDKESTAIKEEDVRYWDTLPVKFDLVIMGVDPADKEKERNDFSGIAVRGVLDCKSYSLYTKGVKLKTTELTDFVLQVFEKFKPDAVNIETNKGQRLADILKDKHDIPVGEVHQTKDKYTRLVAISPQYETHKVYHRPGAKDQDCIDQITSYPDTEHDDIMDARVLTFQDSDVTNFLFSILS